MTKLRVLDLFSGIGGFSLGLERTNGFETVAFCEIEPFCRRVLAKHWPHVPCYEDVRTLTAERLRADGIAVDVICGGFPCQDISNAGKKAGMDGGRSGLWSEIARLVRDFRPRFVLVENVSALLGLGMDRVLADLAEIGFDAEWHCIPASAIGAPHVRDRVWIVAYPSEERSGETWQLRYQQLAQWISRCGSQGIPADARQERTKGRRETEISGLGAFSWCENVRMAEDLRNRPDLPEPLFRGSRDGVPDWVDRCGALGNAVVPQIPEIIGRAILASMQEAA